jgi:amino acid adenylation domain-containing protein
MGYLLHQLLQASTRRFPNRTAVVLRDRSLTYAELDRTSDQLAYALTQAGVIRGDRIGFCLNKSIETIIAIFGILKAGAVYVPLDPFAPPKRLAYIVQNCAMKALIGTDRKISTILSALPEEPAALCLFSTDGLSWEALLASNYVPCVSPVIERDLAYILYTSGSTGEPKGVMISHRTSLTFVDWAHETFAVGCKDRVASHAPLHFDLSIFDIFASVKAGATIVLVPEELSTVPLDLARFVAEQEISIWYSVPSALTRMILHGNVARYSYPRLRTILFAGEVFPVKYLRELRRLIPNADYYNLYGPTETNVCTYYAVKDLPVEGEQPIPIGKACANIEVFAVNDRNEICAPGEEGELYVRGSCIAQGYWGASEKTRQQIVPFALHAPFDREPVYRTGDIVKQDGNGDYTFIGRRDHMIKSRGYRIELGEIETALYSHPKVLEAAVIAIPDEQIGNTIRAFLVLQEPGGVSKTELERHCAQRIPKYMLPGEFEFCGSLPKTSTGKVNKTLLLAQVAAVSQR